MFIDFFTFGMSVRLCELKSQICSFKETLVKILYYQEVKIILKEEKTFLV